MEYVPADLGMSGSRTQDAWSRRDRRVLGGWEEECWDERVLAGMGADATAEAEDARADQAEELG